MKKLVTREELSPIQQGYVCGMQEESGPRCVSNPYFRWSKKHRDWEAGRRCAVAARDVLEGRADESTRLAFKRMIRNEQPKGAPVSKKKEKDPEPTSEEILAAAREQQAEARSDIRAAAALAAKAFRTKTPSFEEVAGIADLLYNRFKGDQDFVIAQVDVARGVCDEIFGENAKRDSEDVLAVCDILHDDVEEDDEGEERYTGEEHLRDARAVAVECFGKGVSVEDILAVYRWIYEDGEPEDDE